jgi:hypothetical protein
LTSSQECETDCVVSLEKLLGIEDAAGQVVDVDTHERVWLAGVAADPDQIWMRQEGGSSVDVELKDTVFVTDSAAVPL